jgi:hypothetical protein
MIWKNTFWKTLEITPGFCFVISVTLSLGLILGKKDNNIDMDNDDEFL